MFFSSAEELGQERYPQERVRGQGERDGCRDDQGDQEVAFPVPRSTTGPA